MLRSRYFWLTLLQGLWLLNAKAQPSIYSMIYDFSRGPTKRGDFYYASAVIEGEDGRLYGTTSAGGSYSNGTVFTIERDGSGYRALHSFATPPDGTSPTGVIEGSDGRLYGTTFLGGASNLGTIY